MAPALKGTTPDVLDPAKQGEKKFLARVMASAIRHPQIELAYCRHLYTLEGDRYVRVSKAR